MQQALNKSQTEVGNQFQIYKSVETWGPEMDLKMMRVDKTSRSTRMIPGFGSGRAGVKGYDPVFESIDSLKTLCTQMVRRRMMKNGARGAENVDCVGILG